MNNSKKVCICVPCYNNQDTIHETLESIVNQDYKNISIIIIDNCSTDKTVEVIADVIDKHTDVDMRLIVNEKNIGAANNWNKCIENIDGDYFCIYHADDVYHSDIVSKEVNYLNTNFDYGLVFTESVHIDENGNVKGKFEIPLRYADKGLCGFEDISECMLTYGNIMLCPSVMFRSNLFYGVNYRFDSKLRYAFDLDFYINIGKFHKIGFIKEKLIKYRLFSNSSTSYRSLLKYKNTMYDEFIMILTKYCEKENRKDLLRDKRFIKKYNQNIKLKMIHAFLNGDYTYAKNMLKLLNKDSGAVHLLLWRILVHIRLPLWIRKLLTYQRYKKYFINHFSEIILEVEE